MSRNNDTIQKTVLVAVLLCVFCSVIVSTAAVMLKPVQVKNKSLDMKTNILAAAGMLVPGSNAEQVEKTFGEFQVKLVDLETGLYVDAKAIGATSADAYDQKRASKDPALSAVLPSELDTAGIKRREKYAKVYLSIKDGKIDRIVLPIRGYGLWSTLWGFMALEGDANTVIGLGFYEHAETPGLGGEVDNPNWKASWSGKKVYADSNLGSPVIELIKGTVDSSAADAAYKIDGLSGATLTSRGVTNLVHYWLGDQGFAKYLTNLRAGEV